MTEAETYLGDGLYASHDGYQFKLRAPTDFGDYYVYLDAYVLQNFLNYAGETLGVQIAVTKVEGQEDD